MQLIISHSAVVNCENDGIPRFNYLEAVASSMGGFKSMFWFNSADKVCIINFMHYRITKSKLKTLIKEAVEKQKANLLFESHQELVKTSLGTTVKTRITNNNEREVALYLITARLVNFDRDTQKPYSSQMGRVSTFSDEELAYNEAEKLEKLTPEKDFVKYYDLSVEENWISEKRWNLNSSKMQRYYQQYGELPSSPYEAKEFPPGWQNS